LYFKEYVILLRQTGEQAMTKLRIMRHANVRTIFNMPSFNATDKSD